MRKFMLLGMLALAGCSYDADPIPKWAVDGGNMACGSKGGVSTYSVYPYEDNAGTKWARLKTTCANGDTVISNVRGPRILTQIDSIEARPYPDQAKDDSP